MRVEERWFGPAGRGAPSRRALALTVVPIVLLVAATNLGNALLPQLVDNQPEVLIGLSASNRNLLLVQPTVDLAAYYVIGTLRLLAPDPFFWLLGWWYGERAIRWMEDRTTNAGSLLRRAESIFGRWGWPLVFIAPNNWICLLAGASTMPFLAFLAVSAAGTVARLALLAWLGDIFSTPLDWILGFIQEYRPWLLAISIAATAFTVWNELRSGASEIQQLSRLEHELDDASDPDGAAPTEGPSADDGPAEPREATDG